MLILLTNNVGENSILYWIDEEVIIWKAKQQNLLQGWVVRHLNSKHCCCNIWKRREGNSNFYHDRKTFNVERMNFLSKLARYCNFEQQVISLNLPNRRTILTCGKRTVVVYLICKIYNYISSRTIRFRRNVPSFIEPVCEGINETPKKVALKLITTITIIIAWLFPFSF